MHDSPATSADRDAALANDGAAGRSAPPGSTAAEREFDRLVGAHQDRVARLAHRLLGWTGDVDDVVQDVFLAALRGWSRFRYDSRPETWLTRITINACRAHARRRRPWLRLLVGRTRADSPDALPAPERAAGRADTETLAAVRTAVRGLPLRQREVVVLYYLEQRPVREIAELLDLRPNTVDARLTRARRALAERLAPLVQQA